MTPRYWSVLGIGALWLIGLVIALWTRPLLPVDETRYVAVAWEMWQRDDFLVPWLNGEPYSHKPPLFFWMIHAGWWLFGVNEWWPRCVAALVSLAALLASAHLARTLWPEDEESQNLVPWVMFGSIFWTAFYTWVQIDMLLVMFSVLAMIGIVIAARGRMRGWLLSGVGIGLGVLSKGPVILLHVLPVALLGPLWLQDNPFRSWRSWYAGIGISLAIGSLITLAWVLPAVQAGGEGYRHAILWGQTANRIVNSFAHAHPWWWYLPWLPVLFAPWLLMPWLWRPLASSMLHSRDMGQRLCRVWLLSVLVLSSLVSGKQIKYLLPLLPAFTLMIVPLLTGVDLRDKAVKPRSLAVILLLIGGFLLVVPLVFRHPVWVTDISPVWGGLIMASAVVLAFLKPVSVVHYPVLVAVLSVWLIVVVDVGVFRTAAPAYDLRAASHLVAAAQEAGRPIISLSGYHGQFGFYGRLTEPLESIDSRLGPAWARRHPDGYMIAYYSGKPYSGKLYSGKQASHPGRVFTQFYRGGYLVVWKGSSIAADPDLLP
jgi:4-amino-4-deoxy-L-arabinose transferase-like glycosyltransferase